MQENRKCTLYFPESLHSQLKIQAAVSRQTMTEIARAAIVFYLSHPEVVEQHQIHGNTHRVYHCPACSTAVVMKEGEMVPVGQEPEVAIEDVFPSKLVLTS